MGLQKMSSLHSMTGGIPMTDPVKWSAAKITLQQKIAELERRIEALEARLKGISFTEFHSERSLIFGDKWNHMWKAFHEFFDEVHKL
jgi:hypothetical protein